MVVMTLYGVRICSSLPVFPGRETELFSNDSSESPRDHSFPAVCSSAQLPVSVPLKAQLQARSSRIGLGTLKCGSSLSARLLFLTPFCREGADHGDCRCGRRTHEQASRWWHRQITNNVRGDVAGWVLARAPPPAR